jgi:hypothetical protein
MSTRGYIDERFCGQVGTERQHAYVCYLASRLGYDALRYAVAEALGWSVSRCGRRGISVRDAARIIDYLKAKLAAERKEANDGNA